MGNVSQGSVKSFPLGKHWGFESLLSHQIDEDFRGDMVKLVDTEVSKTSSRKEYPFKSDYPHQYGHVAQLVRAPFSYKVIVGSSSLSVPI